MTCDHCGHDVPEGIFCARCGAHQGTTGELEAKGRRHAYAAQASEHLATPNLLSTILPHLGRHMVHQFRWALLAGVAGILILYAVGLIAAALVAAAFVVPVLYLLYLYESQVYREEPVSVLGLTLAGGIAVGLVVTLVIQYTVDNLGLGADPTNVSAFAVVVIAVLVAISQEVLKPIPALVLRGRAAFPDTMDGLVFGIAAGLGFSVAESLVRFSSVITGIPVQTDPANWLPTLLTLAVLQPVMQGSCTGLVVAALWRGWGNRSLLAVAFAIIAHAGFVAVEGLGAGEAFVTLLFQALIVGGLLVAVRYVLHSALIEEAQHAGFTEQECPNCHLTVTASAFCPNCGQAMSAAPRRRKAHEPSAKDAAYVPLHRLTLGRMLAAVLATLVVTAAAGSIAAAAFYEAPVTPPDLQGVGAVPRASADAGSDWTLVATITTTRGGPACDSTGNTCATFPSSWKKIFDQSGVEGYTDPGLTGVVMIGSNHNQTKLTTTEFVGQFLQQLNQKNPGAKLLQKSKPLTLGGKQGVYLIVAITNKTANPGHAFPQLIVVWYASNQDGSTGYVLEEVSMPNKLKQFPAFVKSANPILNTIQFKLT